MRATVLLVLTVLVGLLGMHGTGTATVAAADQARPHQQTMAASEMAAGEMAAEMAGAQQHACHDDGAAGRHGSHTDATCAAASVPGPPAASAVAASAPRASDEEPGPRAATPSGPAGGRPPPSLAELQLLRI